VDLPTHASLPTKQNKTKPHKVNFESNVDVWFLSVLLGPKVRFNLVDTILAYSVLCSINSTYAFLVCSAHAGRILTLQRKVVSVLNNLDFKTDVEVYGICYIFCSIVL
jgi:hypothetical protein